MTANGEFTKETDIMDVWFDSGSSWTGVVVNRPELTYPADLYLGAYAKYSTSAARNSQPVRATH